MRPRIARGGRIWALVLAAALLTAGSAGSAPAAVRQPAVAAATTGPGGSTVHPVPSYCPHSAGAATDLMTVYTPAGATMGDHFPTLLFVHGGGWEMGNSSPPPLSTDGYALAVATQLLSTGGFVVATIDYRLGDPSTNPPGNQFPDQIIDVNCAIRYLRANADPAFVDVNRIYGMGSSAGGHLVSLAGLSSGSTSVNWECQSGDTQDWCHQPSALDAVVDEWGVSDFTDSTWGLHASQVIQRVFGHTPGVDNPILEQASPVTYITSAAPPFLIIQGDEDPLNTPNQAPELLRRLALAGNTNDTLYLVHHAAHGALEPGEQPGITQLVQTVVNFIEQQAGT